MGTIIIPAIDLMEGRVVRLFKGDKERATFYDENPVNTAKKFERMGFRRIHIVDLTGAMKGEPFHMELILKIKDEVKCELQVGGGIRNFEAGMNYLKSGIDYIMVSSMAYTQRESFERLVRYFPGRVILCLDVKEGRPLIRGWVENLNFTPQMVCEEFKGLPIKAILFTSVERDGTLEGPDVKGLEEFLRISPFPVIYAGGISSDSELMSLLSLRHERLEGVVVGRGYYEGKVNLPAFVS